MQADRWLLRRRISPEFLASVGHLDPLLATVLYARKFDTVAKIDTLFAEAPLEDPLHLADMDRAVDRLRRAIADCEEIVVYGDYDVDGVCATALATTGLRQLGARVRHYIPDRFAESYGLNQSALKQLCDQGAQVVLTVDCGVRSVAEIAYANEIGLDVIVTDHHSVPAELPPAVAVIDPKRIDSAYAFTDLAGVGVVYRLLEALANALAGEPGHPEVADLDQHLDLVALATVADVVPLLGENRTLVQRGLLRLRTSPRPGLRALAEVAGVDLAAIDSQAIGFRLGPRINAAGRLRSAEFSLSLLMSESEHEARQCAEELDSINQERQRILERQLDLATSLLGDDRSLVLTVASPGFHEGIVGLVASRLCDLHYRPALVMRCEPDGARGSARSIPGFHITHALDACADLLDRYGGHAGAAGFSLASENVPALAERLAAYAGEHLDAETLARRHDVDAIVRMADVSLGTVVELARLEPFGEGNPEPLFATLDVRIEALRAVGREANHLRLVLRDGQQTRVAIAFRMGHLVAEFAAGDRVDLLYAPQANEWNGRSTLQWRVEAVRRASAAASAP